MTEEEKKVYMQYCKYDKEPKEVIMNLIDAIQKQQEEIEDCKKCVLREDVHNYIEELEKKDTLINTMQAEFERLEDLEDNTDMLKMELEKKDKDKQKLIEKLEEEHRIAKTKYSETLSPYQYGRLDVIEEILSFVKGEKNERAIR